MPRPSQLPLFPVQDRFDRTDPLPDILPGILDDFGLSTYFSDVLVDDDKGPRRRVA